MPIGRKVLLWYWLMSPSTGRLPLRGRRTGARRRTAGPPLFVRWPDTAPLYCGIQAFDFYAQYQEVSSGQAAEEADAASG